jgi:hypothetical protein
MKSSVDTCIIREKMTDILYAWSNFCKFTKRNSRKLLTTEEKNILETCRDSSIQPLQPALEALEEPFPGWSPYMMYPPDRLHTLIGFLEMYLSLYTLCLSKISTMQAYKGTIYAEGVGNLDNLLKKFPIKHALPIKMKNFSRGITEFCPSLNNEKKKTGYGSLGLIDSEDIPQLLLQVLFCKFFLVLKCL